MSVISESNKQILWEVLNGMVDENDLKIQDVNQFRQFFENQCKNFHSKRFDYNGLSEINKLIISVCFDFLTKTSQDAKLVMFRDYEKFGNTNIVKSLQIGKRYEEHETNFKKLMNNKKPGEIDFSENTDEPIGNMDNALSQKMENRDAELNNITKRYDTNDSIKWLNSGGVPKLNIHEDVNLDVKPTEVKSAKKSAIKSAKKVKFKINSNSNTNSNPMDEYFSLMNDGMNKDIKKKENEINMQNDVIKEVERRENLVKKDVNLDTFYGNMRIKSKDSDIKAARNQTDVVDINQRIDKLETYLFDIMNNQIKILEKFDKM